MKSNTRDSIIAADASMATFYFIFYFGPSVPLKDMELKYQESVSTSSGPLLEGRNVVIFLV